MTAKHGAAQQHQSAANHHQQAARYHREASKHYQVGKDYAHAAHQALVAHGHALRAIDHAYEAGKFDAEHDGNAVSPYSGATPRIPAQSIEADGTTPASLNGAEHHTAAADHHENAARHHGKASHHWGEDDYASAAHEALVAYGYAQNSIFHGNEAAKHHSEHYGKSGPTAEIL